MKQIAGRPFNLDRSTTPLQVSFGVASANGRAPLDLDTLMHDADAALREAKRAARAESDSGNAHIELLAREEALNARSRLEGVIVQYSTRGKSRNVVLLYWFPRLYRRFYDRLPR